MRIAIFGAGVGGLAAAHFLNPYASVTVYESTDRAGGLARSEGPWNNSREISWRVYFSFYRHLLGIFDQVPSYDGKPIREHLVPYRNVFSPPLDLSEILQLRNLITFAKSATSCTERIQKTMDVPWHSNIANADSVAVPQWLGLDRYRASYASVYLVGIEQSGVSRATDWVLDGPTNQVWIDPWVDYLEKRGVQFKFSSRLESVTINGNQKVTGAMVDGNPVEADIYILAIPIQALADIGSELCPTAPELARRSYQIQLAFQFFLKTSWSLGHDRGLPVLSVLLGDSSWSLIIEAKDISWDDRSHGQWSVTVCQADVKSPVLRKSFSECSESDAAQEIIRQMLQDGKLCQILEENNPDFHGDLEIVRWTTMSDTYHFCNPLWTSEPKFSNNAGTKALRPSFCLGENVYLATAYTRETIDIFSMEAATISGKMVAHHILGLSPPKLPDRPWWGLNGLRALDLRNFRKGRPNLGILYVLGFLAIIVVVVATIRSKK